MNILFYGAGVIGSIMAVKLKQAGHKITVIEKGSRAEQIRRDGIIIENGVSGVREHIFVDVLSRLQNEMHYDIAIVPVRADHLSSILPELSKNKGIRDIVFMVNNPNGYDEIISYLGKDRFFLGFPGMGGGIIDGVVYYEIAPFYIQPTTFGELDGGYSKRLKLIKNIFKHAGFPVTYEKNMDAWQKSHVAWVTPFSAGIYMAGGSAYNMSSRPDIIKLSIQAIREAFDAMNELGVKVTPSKLNMLRWLPVSILFKLLRSQLKSREWELFATLHCKNAPEEQRQLADDLLKIVEKTSVKTEVLKEILDKIPAK